MTKNEFLTLCVAIYGAVVATAVLIWDVIKWARGGPRLAVRVTAGMAQVQRGFFQTGGPHKAVVLFNVYNEGDAATTITTATYMVYRNRWDAFWRRGAERAFAIVTIDPELPRKLEPGEQWLGTTEESDELTGLIRDRVVYAEVYQAGRAAPHRVRLRP